MINSHSWIKWVMIWKRWKNPLRNKIQKNKSLMLMKSMSASAAAASAIVLPRKPKTSLAAVVSL